MVEGGGRRGVVFGVLVVVLALVGIYLTMWPDSDDGQQPPPVRWG